MKNKMENIPIISPKPVRISEKVKIPHVKINVKAKKFNVQKSMESPISYLIKLEKTNSKGNRPTFHTPKKARHIDKKPDELQLENDNFNEKNCNFVVFSPDLEEREAQDFHEVYTPSTNRSPKFWKNKVQKNLNYVKFGSNFSHLDPNYEKFNLPSLNFPVTFKIKKTNKKGVNSVYPQSYFDKFALLTEKNDSEKPEEVLKPSDTPSPEIKSPKYIRHESYRAGFFLSRIERVLNRIKANRSKSSVANSLAKSSLRSVDA